MLKKLILLYLVFSNERIVNTNIIIIDDQPVLRFLDSFWVLLLIIT